MLYFVAYSGIRGVHIHTHNYFKMLEAAWLENKSEGIFKREFFQGGKCRYEPAGIQKGIFLDSDKEELYCSVSESDE